MHGTMAPWHRACRHYNKSEHSTALYFGFRFSEYQCHWFSYRLTSEDASIRRLRNTGNQWTSDMESHIHKLLAFVGSKGALAGSQQTATGPWREPAESNPQVTVNCGTVNHSARPRQGLTEQYKVTFLSNRPWCRKQYCLVGRCLVAARLSFW
jgi:hypothetical protein